MTKDVFYEQVRDFYFEDVELDFEAFKAMIRSAAPIFGKLEVEISKTSVGGKIINFIDNDTADLVVSSKDVNVDDVDTTMRTSALKLHLNKDDVIEIVEHNMGIFTPANKNKVLLYSHFIGKKLVFSY